MSTQDSSLIAILTALEAAYGTDPGSGHQGLLANAGASIKPAGTRINRDTARGNRSPQGSVIGAKTWGLNLPVELKGGGMNGATLNKPEHDHLLQACAMSVAAGAVITLSSVSGTWEIGEAVTNTTQAEAVGTVLDVVQSGTVASLYILPLTNMPADADVLSGDDSGAGGTVAGDPADAWVYAPQSDRSAYKSATIHFHHDGIKHVATGARGTWDLDTKVDGYGILTFSMMGLYADPADVSLPNPALYDVDPVPCHNAGLQLAGVDMTKTAVNSLHLRLGNETGKRPDMNALEGIRGITIGKTRNAGGSLDPEVIDLADFNPWAAWKAGTGQRLYATFGTEAGNRVRVLVKDAQYDDLSYRDRDGLLAYQLPFTARGVSGDDELYLIYY